MAKRTAKISKGMSMQQELFSNGMEEGALDIDLGLRQCFSRSMSNCGKDRYQIAAEMSRLMKASITKEMLDKYAASDTGNGMRVSALAAFCYVTRTFEPVRYLLEPLGSDVLDPADRDLIELARIQEQMKALENEKQRILAKRGLK